MTGRTLPQVDAAVPRFNQAMVAALTALAFVLQIWALVGLVLAVIALNRFAGARYGLFTQLYVRFIRPRRTTAIENEWAAPPRFAQLLGVLFLGLAMLLFAAGIHAAGWAVTLLVTALATLAAATRICVGCMLYETLVEP